MLLWLAALYEAWEGMVGGVVVAGYFVSIVRKESLGWECSTGFFPVFIGGPVHETASFTFKVDFLSRLNLSGNALIGKCKGLFPW